MKEVLISYNTIKETVAKLLNKEWNVITPSPDGIRYTAITSSDEINLVGDQRPTNISVKEFFFPKTDPVFYFKKNQSEVELIDAVLNDKKNLFLGIKPCDAAGIPVLDKVFNWDYKDEFFNSRVNNSVIIGLACSYSDPQCFCTSVNLNPDSTKGSDLFLIPVDNSGFRLQVITEKGSAFLKEFGALEETSGPAHPKKSTVPYKKFDYDKVKNWLDNNFQSDFWKGKGELCLGCAQCAFVCPVCHCFDIIDESCGYECGRRVKNWDACQFGLFTKHASGHNPRNDQSKRYRQRINHKFKYYDDKFGEILCTGCGRCSRGCVAGIDIGEILAEINTF
ncbi:MAG: 4Fe-4S dicluster domain-containing protein [Ignavibacteriaceae bacterium]